MSYRRVRLSLIALLVGLVSLVSVGALSAQEGSGLLQGADFEDSFSGEDGDAMRVGEGWEAWYLDAEDECHDRVPEFVPSKDIDERNHSGRKSTQIGIRDATYTAGIFQVVDGVEPGQTYKFTIWGHVLYSVSPTDTTSSGPDPRMKVGIDPTGGINPFADTVRWGPVDWSLDNYLDFSVVATAEGSTLTVFTYATQPECLPSNFTFWDDASLEVTDDNETPAEIPDDWNDTFREIPADATVKTSTTEFEVGSAVSAPAGGADSSADTDAAASGSGSICLLMFVDANSNGSREVQEAKLSGGVFTLTNGSQVVSTYTTDGNEPYCFSGLAPGGYMLTWQLAGYEATSTQGWAVTLNEGETLSREFGATGSGDIEAQVEGSGGTGRLLRSVALAVGALLFLLIVGGGVVFVLSRMSRRAGDDSEEPTGDVPFPDEPPTIEE